MEIWQKAVSGQKVKLVKSYAQIPVDTVGVVSEVHSHSQTYTVRLCGVDLYLYGNDFEVLDGIESSGNTETSGDAGGASESSSIAGSTNGQIHEAGALDGGADAGAKPYSVAQAVSDLEALAYAVGFEKDEYILDIAEKLKTIVA